jgi:hypothetical protein
MSSQRMHLFNESSEQSLLWGPKIVSYRRHDCDSMSPARRASTGMTGA